MLRLWRCLRMQKVSFKSQSRRLTKSYAPSSSFNKRTRRKVRKSCHTTLSAELIQTLLSSQGKIINELTHMEEVAKASSLNSGHPPSTWPHPSRIAPCIDEPASMQRVLPQSTRNHSTAFKSIRPTRSRETKSWFPILAFRRISIS